MQRSALGLALADGLRAGTMRIVPEEPVMSSSACCSLTARLSTPRRSAPPRSVEVVHRRSSALGVASSGEGRTKHHRRRRSRAWTVCQLVSVARGRSGSRAAVSLNAPQMGQHSTIPATQSGYTCSASM